MRLELGIWKKMFLVEQTFVRPLENPWYLAD